MERASTYLLGGWHNRSQLPGLTATYLIAVGLMLCVAFYTAPLPAATKTLTPVEQEALFWKAKLAIKSGDLPRFGRYSAQLRDDPLYPYLLYWRLQRRLSHELPLTIETFLQRYADLPLAPMLRSSWLKLMAKQGRWEEYLEFYEEHGDIALRCYYHYAQHKTGNDKAAWDGAVDLWLVGQSQNKACDPLFAAWQRAGGITRELRWQRIELAMEEGNRLLAGRLARPLDKDDKERLRLWQSAYRDPEVLGKKALQDDNEMNRMIIFHTLKRRANRAPRTTAARWEELATAYAFSRNQHDAMARAIAIGLTYTNDAGALDWFKRLSESARDKDVCNMALRVALRHQRWSNALGWIQAMPEDERDSTRSKYWRGRIYENMGLEEVARYFFQAVSKEPGYYGFLAADRLNLPYNLNDGPIQVDTKVLHRIAIRADILRAEKLYRYGLKTSARHEWEQAIEGMSRQELLAASKLAKLWGWENRALHTMAKADHIDDLNILFPLRFNKTVEKEARRRALDPSWIYAVVRQESAMMPHAQSPVGALGLMQVMPQTGREIAKQLRLAQPNRRQLLKPETNIYYGSYYLRQVLMQFDRNPVLATAAYNAGPHRIKKWYPKSGTMDADIWVDTIPYDETRDYVRRVMAYTVFYDQRLEQPIKRLSVRMPTVSSNKQQTGRCDYCYQSTAVLAKASSSSH